MLGAVIRNGNNTLVVDLPTGMMDLQTKLSSIGIDRTAENINLSDEDGDQIRVKLYATEPEEVHLLCLLTPDRTLADANSSMMLLQRANQNSLPRLKCCLLGDNYRILIERHSVFNVLIRTLPDHLSGFEHVVQNVRHPGEQLFSLSEHFLGIEGQAQTPQTG